MTIARSRREGGDKDKIRLSLDVSPELNDLIEDLASRTDGTKSDVLRRAIALMDVAVRANERGKKVGVADEDETLSTEFVGLGVRRVSPVQDSTSDIGAEYGVV